jgi:hypothetical protein
MVDSSEAPCVGRSVVSPPQPGGIEMVGSSTGPAVVVGSGSAPDSRSASGGCGASSESVEVGASPVDVGASASS